MLKNITWIDVGIGIHVVVMMSRVVKISLHLSQPLSHCSFTPTWFTTKCLLQNLQITYIPVLASCVKRRYYYILCTSKNTVTRLIQVPNLLNVEQYNYQKRIHCCEGKGQYMSTHYNPSGLILDIKNDDDAKKFLTQLWDEIQAKVAPQNSVGEKALENLEKLINLQISLRCGTRNIFGLISANPRIVNCNWEKIHNVVMFLNDLGMGGNRLLHVLNNRDIWVSELTTLSDRVRFLRSVGILEGNVQKLVAKCPKVLTLKKGKLLAILNLLKKCLFTREQIVVIINDCPNIFEASIDEIEYIFQYVYFRMGLTDQKQMVQAKLFRHSLQHIKERHLFLLRLGLYETPNVRSRTSIVNPKLHLIIDTSPNRFCKMFRVASVDEFRLFCEEIMEDKDGDDFRDDIDSHDDTSDNEDDYESDDDLRRNYKKNTKR
ncbi:transcription termination factor 4, mitochondrial-like isoform X2 [Anneissia japonica]|uniref:transcription termination factor 4, mitochondrial-like isoform X2 n=1 Tax=Anneissia japonica TaxID=1529436 RepID=UPI0014256436|nr:transcription termination factor 4, mitochondrial-like isoform X2 [Anneissia japonica]